MRQQRHVTSRERKGKPELERSGIPEGSQSERTVMCPLPNVAVRKIKPPHVSAIFSMRTDEFDYHLPPDRIARSPAEPRAGALLFEHRRPFEIFLVRPMENPGVWQVLCKPGRHVENGTRVQIIDAGSSAAVDDFF